MDYSKCPEKQPGLMIIKYQGRTISGLARTIGVQEHQVRAPLHGIIRPNAVVRERLPLILGVPLECLFTADALAAPEREPEAVA